MINQETIKSGLDGLERKILMLINERKALQKEVACIKLENRHLKKEFQHKKEIIADLEQNIKIGKIANHVDNDSIDKSALKKQIDTYISEIDRCIAYLST